MNKQPESETRRLQALQQYDLLDTFPERALDDLTALAAYICEVPISLISLIDERRQWFKSKIGISVMETPRDISFCAHAIRERELFIVPDAREDKRFADNLLVTGEPGIRFYAGAPLVTSEGHALGTLCVIDRVPRQLTEAQQEALRVLSRQVMGQLELRRQVRESVVRERLLEVSEGRYRRLVDSNFVGVIISTTEGVVSEANDYFLRMIGYTREEFENGRIPWDSMTPKQWKDADRKAIEELNATGSCAPFEKEYLHKDGHAVPILFVESTLEDTPGAGICLIVDMTERKRSAEALRSVVRGTASVGESFFPLIARELSQALEVQIALVARVLPNQPERVGTIAVWAEGKLADNFEYALAGTPCSNVVSESMCYYPSGVQDLFPDDRMLVEMGMDAYLGVPLDSSDGRVLGLLVVLHDRPLPLPQMAKDLLGIFASRAAAELERIEVELALRHSEARFRRIFESDMIGMIFWNVHGNIADANDAFLQVVGYSRDELEGGMMDWRNMTPPEYRGLDEKALREVMESGSCATYEKEYVRKDGQRVPILIGGVALPGPIGQGAAFVLDITERRKLEEQLRQSQKMESIGTLAGGIAHDFNNILSAIIGNNELAREDVGPEHPARECLEEIAKASTRAKGLVQQILAFARQSRQERKVIDLEPLIEEIVKMVRATLPASVEVDLSLSPDAPNVLADGTQIHQILVNLCTNAWHALDDNAGKITIELRHVHLDAEQVRMQTGLHVGHYACISVTDTGKGMNAATVERIFEPFFTTKGPGDGTGLGLSAVHGIMRNHEGSITVKSGPGKGTVFRLYFPGVNEQVEATETRPALSTGHGQRLLFVDDEESLVFLAKRLLNRLGYQVTGFTRASDALAKILEDPDAFDVIVTDYNMPGMSGLQFAEGVRRIRPQVPVILTSGYITQDLYAKADVVGVRRIVYKPNTVEELCATLRQLLDESN